jgi:leader peptidase (prepilin peptidase) / N-methyltransferase
VPPGIERPAMMTTHLAIPAVFCAILGSCVGSFLNVCIYRIPRRRSLLRPRSRCPRCESAIRARHNVPVLGWLVLRGRCRDCGRGISPRYPAIEFAVGLSFALPYVVAAESCSGDPWERIGAAGMLGVLLASWTISAVGVFAIAVAYDARSSFTRSSARARHPAGAGCVGPAASAPRPPAGPG